MRIITYAFIFFFCLSAPIYAQDIRQYVKVAPPGSWVSNREIPKAVPEKGPEFDSYYPMVEWQYRVSEQQKEFYGRYVQTLNTATGVEGNSTIKVDFDPSFQTVTLHHLNVIRGGKSIDRLELSEFDIYRAETDREKLIFNGDLQLAYVVPDVRPGDTLDYAFTRRGKNPATGPHFVATLQQKYNDVTTMFYQTVLVHEDVPVYTKSLAGAVEPLITQKGKYRSYDWALDGRVPTKADRNRPEWHYGFPVYQFGSYESWSEVGEYFSRHYQIPNPLPQNVANLVSEIKQDHPTPEARLRAALDRVQRDIRYLGISLVEGGYIPRDPERILDRRYGDCKDMTLLLVTLLKGLGIEADPFLVDTDVKGGVSQSIPKPSAFDHVVVRAKIDDKVFILDPTKGQQLGTLETLQQGQFEKGVVIAPKSPGLIDAAVPEPEFFENFILEFEVSDDSEMALMTSVSQYSMYRADSMWNWYKSQGLEAVETAFLEYYQDNYPNIKQVGEMLVEADPEAGTASFTVKYEIPEAWKTNKNKTRKTFTALARELDSELPEFDGTTRQHPFAMTHPVRTKESLIFNLTGDWDMDEGEKAVDNDAFSYLKTARFEDNVYSEVYTIMSKSDHITAEKYAETMAEIDEIDDGLGVEIYVNLSSDSSEAAGDNGWSEMLKKLFSIVWLSGLLVAVGFGLGRRY